MTLGTGNDGARPAHDQRHADTAFVQKALARAVRGVVRGRIVFEFRNV